MIGEFTTLETDLLDLYHQRLKQYAFPRVRDLVFQHRQDMQGFGRYTYLTHAGETKLEDAYLDHDYLVTSIGQVMSAHVWLRIEDYKVQRLEIISLGADDWGGTEEGWKLADKEGELLNPPYQPR